MASDIDSVVLETLRAQRDLTDVERLRPGVFRAVRRTRRETLQPLRIHVAEGPLGVEVRIVDEDDRRRWAYGEPKGSAPRTSQAVRVTLLGARWVDLDVERRPPTGSDWEF